MGGREGGKEGRGLVSGSLTASSFGSLTVVGYCQELECSNGLGMRLPLK